MEISQRIVQIISVTEMYLKSDFDLLFDLELGGA